MRAASELLFARWMAKILVIEDEPQMRRNLCRILEFEGFAVLHACNGLQGVQIALNDPPDLVLCDVMMPRLDGHGVLAELRKRRETSSVPFIFLTARGEKSDLRAGMNLGADDYLTKPATTDELLQAINARLERQRLQGQRPRETTPFRLNFTSTAPLQRFGLTTRESEILSWVAQGKANSDISVILGISEGTVKKHLEHVFEKMGVENRNAASVRALEILNEPGMCESGSRF